MAHLHTTTTRHRGLVPGPMCVGLFLVGANAVAAAMNFVGIVSILVMPLYLQQVQHHDALTAGAMLLPLFVAATVAAALQAGPQDRPGLSSGVNNTARQAAGALGIAVFGALAQDPASPARFTAGLHRIGALAAVLWLAAAALTVRVVPRPERVR
ncbi:hypothetical protein [Streptomyces sp. NPDC102360]|uniref:hypothetical protein n=1 Tax=Streptomyces sp. NPDC102360 TaxID=3366160 RepID=UPI003803866A